MDGLTKTSVTKAGGEVDLGGRNRAASLPVFPIKIGKLRECLVPHVWRGLCMEHQILKLGHGAGSGFRAGVDFCLRRLVGNPPGNSSAPCASADILHRNLDLIGCHGIVSQTSWAQHQRHLCRASTRAGHKPATEFRISGCGVDWSLGILIEFPSVIDSDPVRIPPGLIAHIMGRGNPGIGPHLLLQLANGHEQR